MTHEKMFPIMVGHEGTAAPCPSAIPWDAIAPYAGNAMANHGQTLERLAERGGLCPEEAYLVMTGRRWRGETFNKVFEIEACNFLNKIVQDRSELVMKVAELTEALERARTYTGLEAQGCPLCTYVEGVFTASCSFHKKLGELQEIVDAAVALVKWHGAGALKGEQYIRLFSLAGNYYLKTQEQPKEPLIAEDPVNRPFKSPLCEAQDGCFGQCGKLLPCLDHPGKEASYCTCTPGGGDSALIAVAKNQTWGDWMTRMHKLYRHSCTTGKCEDCGLVENHSNACHEAAPIRKIEELYDQLDAANLQVAALRKALERIVAMDAVTDAEREHYWTDRAERMRDFAMMALGGEPVPPLSQLLESANRHADRYRKALEYIAEGGKLSPMDVARRALPKKCACDGYGKVVGGDGNFYTCPDCGGTGHAHDATAKPHKDPLLEKIDAGIQAIKDMSTNQKPEHEWAICGWCAGTGKEYGELCPKCHGAGGKDLETDSCESIYPRWNVRCCLPPGHQGQHESKRGEGRTLFLWAVEKPLAQEPKKDADGRIRHCLAGKDGCTGGAMSCSCTCANCSAIRNF